jgi:hypothetical protein
MKIGDEVLIRGKIVDLDSNPQGSAIRVEIVGCKPEEKDFAVTFWIHRLDQPSTVIFQKKETTEK